MKKEDVQQKVWPTVKEFLVVFCLGIQRMGGYEREGRKKSKTTRLIERVMECCTTAAMNELKKYVGSKL